MAPGRWSIYQPVAGRAWAIVLTVPAQQTQQLALEIALPLSVMLVILALFALISLRLGLRVVTRSLQKLSSEADRIAQGQLDRPLQVDGEDEVGQLGHAFEQMRVSLQDRLEELNRLLVVSQGRCFYAGDGRKLSNRSWKRLWPEEPAQRAWYFHRSCCQKRRLNCLHGFQPGSHVIHTHTWMNRS